MSEFAVVISFAFDNEETQSIVLDNVRDTSVQLSSTITEHPLPSGEYAADHMFTNPSSVSLSGSFSLNGSKTTTTYVGSGTKLVNIQQTFEKIKSSGTLCDIVKIHVVDGEARFSHRKHLALNNITWKERINSLDFQFSFREVLYVDIQEYDVSTEDDFLPSVTEPVVSSFTDALIDWGAVDKAVIDNLISLDLITHDFLSYLSTFTTSLLIGVGVAAAFAKITATLIAAATVSNVAKVIVAAAAVIGTIVAIFKWCKRQKYRISQFRKYKDDKKSQQEVVRFSNFTGEIHKNITELNSAFLVYQLSVDGEQECMISIGNSYYIFTFTKNNTSGKYSLRVDAAMTEIDSLRCSLNDISGALPSFYECTSQNYLFRADESGEYVYLLNPSQQYDDLTNYIVLVSSVKVEDFNNMLKDIITNTLLK